MLNDQKIQRSKAAQLTQNVLKSKVDGIGLLHVIPAEAGIQMPNIQRLIPIL